ncbi:chromate transporter [Rubellimicrobium arenae]|uniref:chromate transporter n=1 Tax=Rubellimicrobium arenae TaxID=2817372 RepID=UPI001B30550D|nr:chromate transporter [Rubellimicrobium arenae]
MPDQATTVPGLFVACFKIGSLSFGGGLSGWVHREFVQRHGWITDEEFAANLAMAQMFPGVNVVNLVIGLGELLRGPGGAVACLIGFLTTPFFAVLALDGLTRLVADTRGLEAFMEGVAFAAIGMLVVVCGQGIARVRHSPMGLATIIVIAGSVGVLGWSMLPVVLVAAPVSIAFANARIAVDGG